ncbi:MAG: OB-fold nucleic acid binding domain-containing protein, partial [Candidatus Binatota bacterium]
DQMETFARYGFNKSHSAAYAMISYQTAYLKAHFPVEFMAALLSSEMGDTDKVIKNLAECRERGIEVLPPDINESRADFTVVGDKIRFGLAAVKNVGEKAVEVILESREREGVFESLFNFCRRVDLSAVNRRVVENLIKCGAFDSAGVSRARMIAVLDEAMKTGQSYQKGQQSNQIDIFDGLGGGWGNGNENSADSYPEVDEWSAQQQLVFEKESLGFYITGHPLDKYESALKKLTSGAIVNIREKPIAGEVKVGGVVTALKLRNTKKGERYASFQLEDKTGFIEVLVWPDIYRRCMETLVQDDPILVQGRLEVGEERIQVIANDVTPIAQASYPAQPTSSPVRPDRRQNGDGIHFYLRGQEVTSEELGQLHETLLRYPGPCTVFLHLSMPDKSETIIELPMNLKVARTAELLQTVESLFGNRITFAP